MHEVKMDAPGHGDSSRVRPLATAVLRAAAALYVLRLAGPVVVPVLLAVTRVCAGAAGQPAGALAHAASGRAAFVFALLAFIGEAGRSVADAVGFLDGLPAALAEVSVHVDRGSGHPPGPLSRVQQAAAVSTRAQRRLPRRQAGDIVRGGFDVRAYLRGATRGMLNSIGKCSSSAC